MERSIANLNMVRKKKGSYCMLGLIIGIVLGLVVFVWRGVVAGESEKFKFTSSCFTGLIPIVLGLFASMLAIVPANNVGIIYSPTSGSVSVAQSGWRMKGPLDEVHNISTQVQTQNLVAITGQTKDSQYVDITLDFMYKVDAETAYQVFTEFRSIDRLQTNFIPQIVQRTIEEITTQYNVYDILGEKKPTVYQEIENAFQKALADTGVSFYGVNFIDVDAGEAIETAIRNQAVAAQQVETAQMEREAAAIAAQQQIDTAEAQRDAAVIAAETREIEANAEAAANAIINESLTGEMLQYYWMTRWNGEMPQYYGGNADLMIVPEITPENANE
jgi:regulator of protease activity HflC (stomatin/prohibitin superfamily)